MKELNQLYTERHSQLVSMIANKVGGNREAAEDIVQEAFCKCFENVDKYDEEKGTVSVWFNSVLFNTLRDVQRGYKKDLENLDVDQESEEVVDGRPSASPEVVSALVNAIDAIKNETHRRVLRLFYINGYTSTEISAMEGVSQTNVTTIVKRFK